MAKTRKKELSFFIKGSKEKSAFLEQIRKKVTMVNIHIIAKQDKIRLILSGPQESLRYAISLIKRIQASSEKEKEHNSFSKA